MTWKKIKILFIMLTILAILIPTLLYFSAIDLSKNYTADVQALPIFDATKKDGLYRVKANNFEFKTRIAGFGNTGDNIIFLHGFPQSSRIWELTMNTAAENGYRVAAFDQRGYSPGARPSGKENYQIQKLVKDVLDVADELGFTSFHLVGHDWGASVGWSTVINHPDRIKTWTALSIPHINVFQDALQNDPEQQKRSHYISKLQLPILPELLFVLNRKKLSENLKNIWRDVEIDEVNALFAEYGAMTAALNWYRAIGNDNDNDNDKNKKELVTRSTLFIWGNQDEVVAPHIIPLQKDLIEASYKEVELDAGHSLIQEERDTITKLMLSHWE